jgi:hypothetical protein
MKRIGQTALVFILLLSVGCTGVATVLPGSDVFFQDDFSNPASGWDRVTGTDGETNYAGDSYRLFSALPDYYLWANPGRLFERDVRIEADAIKIGGPNDGVFGLICRYQDAGNFYVFMISADGQAGIARVQSGRDLVMLSGESLQPSSRIQTGLATNHLQADCLGSTFALFVNGEQVASANDSVIGSGGDVGLWLGDFDMPGVDVHFDNFIVRRP